MTRSAEQAIDDVQAKLGERCERLLASSAWNNAHTSTHKGLLKRLQMIPDAGLNPMRVVAHSRLKELGRIPRSHEGHQEDAIAAVRRCGADVENKPKAVLLFYSHRWKRPNWSEDLGKDLPWASAERQQAMREGKRFGDPDDAARSKAKALIAYGDWLKRYRLSGVIDGNLGEISQADDLEIFWWIDWASTDQDAPGPDMAALPAFAAACAGIVAAWSPEYASRAWCQVELLMAHAFMTKGRLVFVVPDGFAGAEPQGDKWVTREEVAVADPAAGQLTNDHDRAVIRSLTGVAERSTAFSCWRVFVKNSTENVGMGCVLNVCLCCQFCGLWAWGQSRKVHPGQSTVEKVLPVGATIAPAQQAMQRAPLGEVGMGPLQGGRAAVAPAPGSVSMAQAAVAVAAPIAAPQPQPFLVGVPPGVGPGQQMMVQSPFTGQQVRFG